MRVGTPRGSGWSCGSGRRQKLSPRRDAGAGWSSSSGLRSKLLTTEDTKDTKGFGARRVPQRGGGVLFFCSRLPLFCCACSVLVPGHSQCDRRSFVSSVAKACAGPPKHTTSPSPAPRPPPYPPCPRLLPKPRTPGHPQNSAASVRDGCLDAPGTAPRLLSRSSGWPIDAVPPRDRASPRAPDSRDRCLTLPFARARRGS